MISSISVSEFLKLRNVFIIDIRSIEKYNNNHIPNAINVPFNKLIAYHYKYLDRNNMYYIYCQKGIKSKTACQILRNLGYKVISIQGGYESWILEK
ncbi:MAG TPA: rhodanese-like domain-containing protein [Tenericutes bacterium]|nr:rhodanese-like domain-containing protein [Mycoplasmatota bacterium]